MWNCRSWSMLYMWLKMSATMRGMIPDRLPSPMTPWKRAFWVISLEHIIIIIGAHIPPSCGSFQKTSVRRRKPFHCIQKARPGRCDRRLLCRPALGSCSAWTLYRTHTLFPGNIYKYFFRKLKKKHENYSKSSTFFRKIGFENFGKWDNSWLNFFVTFQNEILRYSYPSESFPFMLLISFISAIQMVHLYSVCHSVCHVRELTHLLVYWHNYKVLYTHPERYTVFRRKFRQKSVRVLLFRLVEGPDTAEHLKVYW